MTTETLTLQSAAEIIVARAVEYLAARIAYAKEARLDIRTVNPWIDYGSSIGLATVLRAEYGWTSLSTFRDAIEALKVAGVIEWRDASFRLVGGAR